MEGNMHNRKITRREFLKISSGIISATALGTIAVKSPFTKLEGLLKSAQAEKSYKYGVCRMCQQQYCSLKAHLSDGIVTMVEGVPDSLLSNGTLCAAIQRFHSTIILTASSLRYAEPTRKRLGRRSWLGGD